MQSLQSTRQQWRQRILNVEYLRRLFIFYEVDGKLNKYVNLNHCPIASATLGNIDNFLTADIGLSVWLNRVEEFHSSFANLLILS